jgi:hypothetical protein
MRVRSKILCGAAIASTFALAGCGGSNLNGTFGNPEYIAVVISPRAISVPQATTMTFTAAVSNNLGVPQWSLLTDGDPANVGTLTAIAGSPNSILYTAPPTPPIYSSGVLTQGTVTLNATTSDPPQSFVPILPDSVTFYITAPTITVSLNPDTVTVPLGTTFQFMGAEVGSTNSTLTWYVNGVVGGIPLTSSNSAGTISATGFYSAPSTMPSGGAAVTITMVPQVSPTQALESFVTLQ